MFFVFWLALTRDAVTLELPIPTNKGSSTTALYTNFAPN
jgi:hypothetical protein